MPRPLEICIEELDGTNPEEPFIRCVALPGRAPGLNLDHEARVRWMPEGPEAYALWVSADDRLVLFRSEGSAPIAVERGSRRLDAPAGQPVILLDQDLLRLGDRRLRVHVHGMTETVHEPERLTRSALSRLARAAAAAAALALGGTGAVAAGAQGLVGTSGASSPPPIEVRLRPPEAPVEVVAVDCTVSAQNASRGGPLVVHATCPASTTLRVGQTGTLLDPKTGRALPDGVVRIKTVSGSKIVGEAPRLTKPVPAKTLRFTVNKY